MIPGEVVPSSAIPFQKPLDDLSLTELAYSVYAAALLSCSLLGLGGGRWAKSRKSMVLGWILFAGGGFLAALALSLRMLVIGRVLFGIGFGVVVRSIQVKTTMKYVFPLDCRAKLLVCFLVTNSVIAAILINYVTKPNFGEWMVRPMVAWIEYTPLVVGVLFYSFYGPPDAYAYARYVYNARDDEDSTDWEEEEEEEEAKSSAEEEAKSSAEEEKPEAKLSALANFGYLVAALAVPLLMQKLTGLNHVLLFNIPVLFHDVVFGSGGSLLSSVLLYEGTAVYVHGIYQWSLMNDAQ